MKITASLVYAVIVFTTIIASFSLSQVYAESIIYDDDYTVDEFTTGLDHPTTMTFVGDDILILEKNTGHFAACWNTNNTKIN